MEIVMTLPARKFEPEKPMDARIARLEATTEHIQSDVKNLSAETKDFRQEMKELVGKLDAKFEAKSDSLQKSFESMKLSRVWDRVWMLLAMGTLLGVMARGFKWI